MGKENLVEVIRCKDCDLFIGSDLSNVGHCSMWNKATSKDGYCHHGEKEVVEVAFYKCFTREEAEKALERSKGNA